MKLEIEEIDETKVTLDTYNSDLNLVIDGAGYSAHPLTNEGFAFMWAGARATHGSSKGKFCFEVKITNKLDVSHLPADEPNPHVLRVGFSVESSTMQLGEDPLSYGYGGTGKISTNCIFKDYGTSFTFNDVILAVANMDTDQIQIGFAKNGKFLGWAYRVGKHELKGKALFPHILTKNVGFEVNFGQKDKPYFPLPDSVKEFTFIGCLPLNQRVPGTRAPKKREDCEMVMMCGLPGAGKSVWAADFSRRNPDKKYNILGTNNIIDKMKVMGLPRKRNYSGRWDVLIKMATNCLNKMFEIGSKLRRNYILDQTNVYPTAQRRKMKNFEGFHRKAVVIVPSEAEYKRRCDKRDREEGKEVPDHAVLEMKANFKLPEMCDVFQEVMFTDLQREAAQKLVNVYNEEGKAAVGSAKKFKSEFGASPGGFGSDRGGFSNRGGPNRGGFDGGRGGSGFRGGRGGFGGDRGGFGGDRGGGRGGFGGDRGGGRGGFGGDRGGGRGGYGDSRGGRGGFGGDRGGFGGDRGGDRGGFGGGDRGGFGGGERGGYGGNNGGFGDSRGGDRGFGDSRGGDRGGFGNSRGGDRGGYGGNRGNDRGGYGGGDRGGYGSGGRGSDRGGYGSNRGSDRGGYGNSRGSDRGGYNNSRGNDRGFGGSRGSDRGGYGSDRGSDRGGYGGDRGGDRGFSGERSFGDSRSGDRSFGDSRGSDRGGYGNSRGGYGGGGRDFDGRGSNDSRGGYSSDRGSRGNGRGSFDRGGRGGYKRPHEDSYDQDSGYSDDYKSQGRGVSQSNSQDGYYGRDYNSGSSGAGADSGSSSYGGYGDTISSGARGGYRGAASSGGYRGSTRGGSATSRDYSGGSTGGYDSSTYDRGSTGDYRSSDYARQDYAGQSASDSYYRRDGSSGGLQTSFKKEPGADAVSSSYGSTASTRPSGRASRWSAAEPAATPAYSDRSASAGAQDTSSYATYSTQVKTEPDSDSRYGSYSSSTAYSSSYIPSNQSNQGYQSSQQYSGYDSTTSASQPWSGTQASTPSTGQTSQRYQDQSPQETQQQWSQYYQQPSQTSQYYNQPSQYYG